MKEPGDLWTVDFKGWWNADDGARCEPLTVRDAHSRFLLCAPLMHDTCGAIHVPISRLADEHPELGLDPAIPVGAICLSAHRSIPATRLLTRHGYDAVQLAGGTLAWRKAKLPEVRGSTRRPRPRR